MAFICCDPIVLLQIMQVRWGFHRLPFEELCLMGYGEDTRHVGTIGSEWLLVS